MRQPRWLLGLVVAVACLLCLVEGAAAALCVNPPSGVALWLTGDNNTTDLSGFGNSGTATWTSRSRRCVSAGRSTTCR